MVIIFPCHYCCSLEKKKSGARPNDIAITHIPHIAMMNCFLFWIVSYFKLFLHAYKRCLDFSKQGVAWQKGFGSMGFIGLQENFDPYNIWKGFEMISIRALNPNPMVGNIIRIYKFFYWKIQ